jgi:hypothetical protein
VDYYKKNRLSGNRTAFMFDSLGDYNKFIDETTNSLPRNSNAKRVVDGYNASYIRDNATDVSFFGTRDRTLITDNVDTYLFNNVLDGFLNTLRDRTINLDVIDLDQQKAIKFTEQEIGVFSFDLASLGLIPVVEFYSPLLNKIVSANLVRSEKKSNGSLYFYHIYQPEIKKHIVQFNASYNGYYSEVLKRLVPKDDLVEEESNGDIIFYYPFTPEVQKHKVDRRQKVDEKGKKKFSTTWKKSFVYMPKVEKPLPRIDIIIVSSFSSTNDAQSEMIYNGLSAIAIAEKLSKANVNYRIIAAYPIITPIGTQEEVYSFITLKKEGEVLDKNKIALLLSDGRHLRLKRFKGLILAQYDAGFDAQIDEMVGYTVNDTYIIIKNANKKYELFNRSNRTILNNLSFDTEKEAEDYAASRQLTVNRVKNAYIDYLELSDSPSDKKAAENRDSKIVFGVTLSQQQAEDQYNDIIGQISRIT